MDDTIRIPMHLIPAYGFPETPEQWHSVLGLPATKVVERVDRIDYHDERGEVVVVYWRDLEDSGDVTPEHPAVVIEPEQPAAEPEQPAAEPVEPEQPAAEPEEQV